MEPKQLHHLSVTELQEIEKCVQAAMQQKNDSRLQEAKGRVIDFIGSFFPDVNLADLLEGIWLEHTQVPSPGSTIAPSLSHQPVAPPKSEPNQAVSHSQLDDSFIQALHKLIGNLKSRHRELTAKEEARLLWLMNNGRQKLSKISGSDLANVLQEAITKAEEIANSYHYKPREDLEVELQNVSSWFEAHTQIPLLNGIFTVISACTAREQVPEKTPQSKKGDADLLMPFITQRH